MMERASPSPEAASAGRCARLRAGRGRDGRPRPPPVRQGARRRLRRPLARPGRGRTAGSGSARRSPPGRTPTRATGRPARRPAIMTGAPLPAGADAVVMIEQTRTARGEVVLVDDPVGGPGPQPDAPRPRDASRRGRPAPGRARSTPRGSGCSPRSVGPRSPSSLAPGSPSSRPATSWSNPTAGPAPGRSATPTPSMLQALAASCDAEAEALPIAPDELDRPPRDARERAGRRRAADHRRRLGGQPRPRPRGASRAWASTASSTRSGSSPASPSGSASAPPRRDGPGTLVFGLPGNPVSGVVGFLLFVRPALDRLSVPDRRPAVS